MNLNKTQRVGLCLSSCIIITSCALILYDKSQSSVTPNNEVAKEWITHIVKDNRKEAKDLMSDIIKPNIHYIMDRYVINPGGEFNDIEFIKDVDGYLEFVVTTDNTKRYPKWSLRYNTANDKITRYEFNRLNPLDKRDDTYAEVYS